MHITQLAQTLALGFLIIYLYTMYINEFLINYIIEPDNSKDNEICKSIVSCYLNILLTAFTNG